MIGVSFLPVLALEAQEGRLFKPLAYTKTLAMLVAAVLAVTLDPALRMLLTRPQPFAFRPAWLRRTANTLFVGTIRQEERHPVSRVLMRIYAPVAAWTLRRTWVVFGAALLLVAVTVPAFLRLGTEFMPPLEEGSLFYMPTTMPGISVTEAGRLLQVTDRIIKSFPEVERVLGKAGRAGTSTDPAPLSMLETVVTLKPKSAWRKVDTWYSSWAPEWLKGPLRRITPDTISQERLIEEMNEALRLPGPLERLDDADQGAHRHARHRHPHAGRPEDLRLRPRRDRAGRRRGRGRAARGCAAPAACSPSAPRAGTSSTSPGSGGSWRATGSPCRRPRTCSPRRSAARA